MLPRNLVYSIRGLPKNAQGLFELVGIYSNKLNKHLTIEKFYHLKKIVTI